MTAQTDPPTETLPPVNPAAVQQAQREAGDLLEAQRQERIASRDNPGHHPSLAAALVAFQREMPVVPRGKTANMGTYSYKYADLADVSAAVTPLLTAHGLAFITTPGFTDAGSPVLRGQLIHALGESIEAEGLPLYGRTAQDIGSSITYNRRYLFGCLTGVVTDEDEDGSLAAANKAAAQAPPPPTPEQQEMFAELTALAPPVVDRVKAAWPQGLGTDVYTLNPGQITQVRAIVDIAIAEQQAADAAEGASTDV